MPRAKKSDVCETPACSKEAAISALQTRLDAHKENAGKIEKSLQKLIDDNATDKKEWSDSFNHISNKITELGVNVNQYAVTTEELVKSQKELIGKIGDLITSTGNISSQQHNLSKQLESHLHDATEWHQQVEKRLDMLESSKSTLIAVGSLIIAMLTAAACVAQIFDALK